MSYARTGRGGGVCITGHEGDSGARQHQKPRQHQSRRRRRGHSRSRGHGRSEDTASVRGHGRSRGHGGTRTTTELEITAASGGQPQHQRSSRIVPAVARRERRDIAGLVCDDPVRGSTMIAVDGGDRLGRRHRRRRPAAGPAPPGHRRLANLGPGAAPACGEVPGHPVLRSRLRPSPAPTVDVLAAARPRHGASTSTDVNRSAIVGCSQAAAPPSGLALAPAERVPALVLLCPGIPGIPLARRLEERGRRPRHRVRACPETAGDVDALASVSSARLGHGRVLPLEVIEQFRSSTRAVVSTSDLEQQDPPVYERLDRDLGADVAAGRRRRLRAADRGRPAATARIPGCELIRRPGDRPPAAAASPRPRAAHDHEHHSPAPPGYARAGSAPLPSEGRICSRLLEQGRICSGS